MATTKWQRLCACATREPGPGELASLRAMWWRQAGAGHRLPAEIGVIVIEGGST